MANEQPPAPVVVLPTDIPEAPPAPAAVRKENRQDIRIFLWVVAEDEIVFVGCGGEEKSLVARRFHY